MLRCLHRHSPGSCPRYKTLISLIKNALATLLMKHSNNDTSISKHTHAHTQLHKLPHRYMNTCIYKQSHFYTDTPTSTQTTGHMIIHTCKRNHTCMYKCLTACTQKGDPWCGSQRHAEHAVQFRLIQLVPHHSSPTAKPHCSSSHDGLSVPGVFSLMLNCLRVCSSCCWFPAK